MESKLAYSPLLERIQQKKTQSQIEKDVSMKIVDMIDMLLKKFTPHFFFIGILYVLSLLIQAAILF
ncbi:hypothetical protein [Evansella cellulosilytica]|uniref:Uncharacterized protein n=1 Tax=Evansella cellulosilytica (strain ATCC 21833 / DSM 2522 / FERM P-1141 / JCM 9156 / N-4) TaxID=649639 RepID=E6TY26_EVAC2|nr:hypothetical protein [Evansella cellulosilytica]ADU31239.1 hypothetical protein Bcell_2989 [Evansella cellulosilytica DSM 2522]